MSSSPAQAPMQNGGYGDYNQAPQSYNPQQSQPYQQNTQNSYNQQPSQSYNQSNSYEQPTPNVAPKEMPTNESIPEIDIDEDEIPF
jgi:single-strand DNA-binding protein